MSSGRSFAIASALVFAVGCGGNAPDGDRVGGGGADGLGNDARPTPAERTGGAPGDVSRTGNAMAALSTEDREFVEKAMTSNQMEIRLGNLAEDKAQNDEVKQFGEQLARDHQSANRALQSSIGGADATTAQQPGSGVSNQPDGAADHASPMHQEMQQTQQKLERASGPAFDRAYLEEMVKHHQKDIQEFERAAKSDNPQIRAFAERTLPTLREHLEKAQQLQQK